MAAIEMHEVRVDVADTPESRAGALERFVNYFAAFVGVRVRFVD